jgi:hypothetical protein
VSKRVVVTGLGCVTPLGPDVQSTWSAMLAGTSGIGQITQFDTSDFDVKIAAEIKGFDPATFMSPKEARRIDRFVQLGLAAATEARTDAVLDVTPENASRMGVIAGSGIGGLASLSNGFDTLHSRGPSRISPFLVVQMLIDLLPGQISINLGPQGPELQRRLGLRDERQRDRRGGRDHQARRRRRHARRRRPRPGSSRSAWRRSTRCGRSRPAMASRLGRAVRSTRTATAS